MVMIIGLVLIAALGRVVWCAWRLWRALPDSNLDFTLPGEVSEPAPRDVPHPQRSGCGRHVGSVRHV